MKKVAVSIVCFIGYVRPRWGTGQWVSNYDPSSNDQFSSQGFVEGDGAQYTWMVPQDPAGLFAALGGRKQAKARLDQFFSVSDMLRDVYKRPFITAGFTGFIVMVPLAITSTKNWIMRLGGKRWQLLHRLTYISGIAGVLHYLWLVKSDLERPLIYGVLLSFLLGFRVFQSLPSRHPSSAIRTSDGPITLS